MKLTKSQIKQLIKEEIQNVLNEQTFHGAPEFKFPSPGEKDKQQALYHIQSAGECLAMDDESFVDDSASGWRACVNVKHLRKALNIIEKHMAVQK